ncbi:hypothetical protein [Klebsiella pneumoniae ISC21]|nr:hypothetical protein [Klebsiella pneumoniae ISC21]
MVEEKYSLSDSNIMRSLWVFSDCTFKVICRHQAKKKCPANRAKQG